MAVSLISTRLLEIISTSAVGMHEAQGNGHFQTSTVIFRDESGGYQPMGPEENRLHTTGLPQPSIPSRYWNKTRRNGLLHPAAECRQSHRPHRRARYSTITCPYIHGCGAQM